MTFPFKFHSQNVTIGCLTFPYSLHQKPYEEHEIKFLYNQQNMKRAHLMFAFNIVFTNNIHSFNPFFNSCPNQSDQPKSNPKIKCVIFNHNESFWSSNSRKSRFNKSLILIADDDSFPPYLWIIFVFNTGRMQPDNHGSHSENKINIMSNYCLKLKRE